MLLCAQSHSHPTPIPHQTSKARNVYVLLDQRRKGAGMLRMSVAALEQVWGATYGSNLAVPEVQRKIRSLKLDLTALAFMCSGNDYLPALKGYRLDVRV